MPEYFVVANSFAAPFFSDTSEEYAKGETPQAAMVKFRKRYDHPAGLFAALLFKNADACYKKKKPLAVWLSKEAEEQEKQKRQEKKPKRKGR